jgi:hypothetical protein
VRNRGFALVRQFHNILGYPNSATFACCRTVPSRQTAAPPLYSSVSHKEIGLRTLLSFSQAFLLAFIAAFVVLLLLSLLVPHGFKPWVAVGIASGIAIASGIRAWRALSTNASAMIVAVLVATGYAVGTWFSLQT